MKKFLPFSILVVFVVLIGLVTYRLSDSGQNIDQQISEDQPLEQRTDSFSKVKISLPDFSLPDLFNDSKDFSKRDLLGKYSVVNFFASWCTTCLAEHEVLIDLQNKNIVDLYGIAWRDIDSKTRAYLKKHGNPFERVAKDSRGLFTKITGIDSIPETLVIDPSGHVVLRFRGNLQSSNLDEIERVVKNKESLSEKPQPVEVLEQGSENFIHEDISDKTIDEVEGSLAKESEEIGVE
jgi:cytochrome c biogenesis protein CcmG/thiol:disulfide interchange protein DsbE